MLRCITPGSTAEGVKDDTWYTGLAEELTLCRAAAACLVSRLTSNRRAGAVLACLVSRLWLQLLKRCLCALLQLLAQ